MLDVDRRVDVDPGVEELLDVLPPLGVPRAGRVRVRELVDEEDAGTPRERGVEVELLERHAAVVDLAPRKELEADRERGGVVAAVGLDDADDDVAPEIALGPRRLEHRVRLADAGRRAEEERELAALGAPLLLAHACEELVGVGSSVSCRRRQSPGLPILNDVP